MKDGIVGHITLGDNLTATASSEGGSVGMSRLQEDGWVVRLDCRLEKVAGLVQKILAGELERLG